MKKDEIVQGVDIKSWSLTQSSENGHKKKQFRIQTDWFITEHRRQEKRGIKAFSKFLVDILQNTFYSSPVKYSYNFYVFSWNDN